MMKYEILILVEKKEGVADPEGNLIGEALHRFGERDVLSVRVAKMFKLVVRADSPSSARKIAEKVATDVLTNPVIEQFHIYDIEDLGDD